MVGVFLASPSPLKYCFHPPSHGRVCFISSDLRPFLKFSFFLEFYDLHKAGWWLLCLGRLNIIIPSVMESSLIHSSMVNSASLVPLLISVHKLLHALSFIYPFTQQMLHQKMYHIYSVQGNVCDFEYCRNAHINMLT